MSDDWLVKKITDYSGYDVELMMRYKYQNLYIIICPVYSIGRCTCRWPLEIFYSILDISC